MVREATEQALLAAGEEVFAEQGLQARVEDIASRAGVAVGTLYNYFGDREGLLTALATQRRAELVEKLEEARAATEGGPWRAGFDAFVQATLAHLEAHRRFFAIVLQGEIPTSPRRRDAAEPADRPSAMHEVYARAEQLVARGLREGVLKREGAALYPALLVGLLRGALVHDRYASASGPLTGLAGPIADFFLEGAGRAR